MRASATPPRSSAAGALNGEGMVALERALRENDFEPAGPAVANFLYAETGGDSRPLFEALLAEGVIVRPLHGFGAPNAIRVTCGNPDENEFFAAALARVARRARALTSGPVALR